MISNKQTSQFLAQLSEKYPQAFKMNFILYGQIKTKGIMDELKEGIPWILALMIFGSLCYVIAEQVNYHFPQFEGAVSFSIASISILMFFMLICPLILKQIKHSSVSLYQHLQHTPLKLTSLIVLQGLNIAFAQSWFLFGVIFFFSLSFGFIKFYKENMFVSSASSEQYDQLQQVRRFCFWSYKQIFKTKFKMLLTNKSTENYLKLQAHKDELTHLHVESIKFENNLCLSIKHKDVETYIDSIM